MKRRDRHVAQLVDCVVSMHKALGLGPNIGRDKTNKQKKEREREKHGQYHHRNQNLNEISL